MSKKIISLLLAVMLTVSMLTVAVVSVSAEEGAAATYIVAGSEEVFGSKISSCRLRFPFPHER